MTTTPAPRQTLSYLRELFRQNGLSPKSKLGQNFLVDLNLMDVMVKEAELGPRDFVLEVGTGTGSLTSRLAQHAGSVLTVEIDPEFSHFAQNVSGNPAHVSFFQGDVLRSKNTIRPEVLRAIARVRERYAPEQLKLVANLPYSVATPVIANLLIGDLPWERMVVMVQWEIAEKMAAAPNSKDFGALSVLVQSVADVEILRKLPPTVFWPMPKVDSGIVRIRPSASKRAAAGDVLRLRRFLRDLYAHRRKNLRGGLLAMPGERAKADVDATLAQLGFDGQTRAETLSVADHLRLAAAFGPTTGADDDA